MLIGNPHGELSSAQRAGFAALTLGVSLWIFACWLVHFQYQPYGALFSDLVYHRAHRPYVYRTLLPTTVNMLTRLIPDSLNQKTKAYVRNDPLMREIFPYDPPAPWPKGRVRFEMQYPVETVIGVILMFGCLTGFGYVARVLFRGLYETPPEFAALVPAVAIGGVSASFAYTSYPYDFCSLLLSSIAFLAMAKDNWRAYLLIFCLMCINKETAILYTGVSAVLFWRDGRLTTLWALRVLAAQIVIFGIVKGALTYLFRNTQGSVVEFHLFEYNIPLLREWVKTGIRAPQLILTGVFLTALFHGWKSKALVLRCGMLMVFPLTALALLFGYLDEWRAYMDIYTPLLMLILGSVGMLFGVRPRQTELFRAEVVVPG